VVVMICQWFDTGLVALHAHGRASSVLRVAENWPCVRAQHSQATELAGRPEFLPGRPGDVYDIGRRLALRVDR
jgi:hypothetical protein